MLISSRKEESTKEEDSTNKLAKSTDKFKGDGNIMELLEGIKAEQNEKLKNVRILMERILLLMQDEISQLEGRLEGKMRGLREEFRKQAKLTLSFKG